jgi:hypothetical protein
VSEVRARQYLLNTAPVPTLLAIGPCRVEVFSVLSGGSFYVGGPGVTDVTGVLVVPGTEHQFPDLAPGEELWGQAPSDGGSVMVSVATTPVSTLTLVAGAGITLTPDALDPNLITISLTPTRYFKPFLYQTANQMVDPGAGGVRLDSNVAGATNMAVSETDADGGLVVASSRLWIGDGIVLSDGAWYASYQMRAALVDQGTWLLIPVAYIGSAGAEAGDGTRVNVGVDVDWSS